MPCSKPWRNRRPQSLVILTAANESDLLATIVSRCLRLKLAPLHLEQVEEWLGRCRGLSGPRARLMAGMAAGCLGAVPGHGPGPHLGRAPADGGPVSGAWIRATPDQSWTGPRSWPETRKAGLDFSA